MGLQSIGLCEQECVALVAENDIYSAVLGDGVVAAGAIFASPPPNASHRELVAALQAAHVDWIFAEASCFERVRAAAVESGVGAERILLFDPPDGEQSVQAELTDEQARRSFSALSSSNEEKYSNPNTAKNPELLIASRLFTSGTTGEAKAAEVSHTATLQRLHDGTWSSGGFLKNLHFIGMHHVSGTTVRQRAAAAGHCSTIARVQDPTQIVDLIKRYQIQSTMLPPRTMIAISRLLQDGIRQKEDLDSLRLVNVGGSGIRYHALDEFKGMLHQEAVLQPVYGSTESGLVSRRQWTDSKEFSSEGFVGTIARTARVKIVDPETDRTLGHDVDGDICITSEGVFNLYCGNEEATDSVFLFDPDGTRWFRTGDKGRLSAKNEVFVTGRYKEVFKVGTEEVAPVEVESTLLDHPAVKDAAVVKTPDRNDAAYNEVKAYVVSESGVDVTPQEIVNHVADNLSAHKAPTGGVSFTESIPRNAMKKVVRRDLEDIPALPGSAEDLTVET